MSDQISPIMRDALGATTFEKVQTIEIQEPDKSAPAATSKSQSCCGGDDGINFSKPMKKFLVQKKSYFTAPPPPSDQQKQKRQDELNQAQADPHQAYGKHSMTVQQAGSLISILG
ncbi:MAG: hypothetical protein CVV27_02815 [Candidatus Melainabacteria bacterium HGW-Melainabacteria-1]|nr:MAG: hypothetical protein CVV27_02815 [Candidatus Melainabacteria bacterium HGW-Melainabacteria-1]